jgi:hypothetical protein
MRERVVEVDGEDAFATVVQQSEAIRRNSAGLRGERRQNVEVCIVVSNDGRNWKDYEVFDRGPWGSSVRLPTARYLEEVARKARTRYARSQKRTII